MILVGAKADLETDRKISHKQGLALAEKFGIEFLETSARENSNIDKVFELLTKVVVGRLGLE
jgi:GTPase SAR1 family protein